MAARATLTAFGAAGEVTGSKHLLDTGHARVLVDCGVFQGRREEAHTKNQGFAFDPRSIDAAINTHGHLDHCGNYPLLVKQGFRGDILATPATRDIAALVMADSARIQEHDARFIAKDMKRDPRGRKLFPPLYTEDDARAATSQYATAAYHRPRELARGVRVELHDAGHILGSSIAVVDADTGSGPLRIAFSGDLGRNEMPIIRDPETLPAVDYLVLESTYGDRLHDPIGDAQEQLATAIRETAARGGRVIIPAFAIERTQELVYFLHQLHDAGRIPALPVYVDSPMAVNASAIFRAHTDCYDAETVREFLDNGENPFSFGRLTYVTTPEASKKLNDVRVPCIIISSSGMCEAGRIVHHLRYGVEDERNTILIVGFMGANTLGRALADKKREVRMFGETHVVRARVKILNAFSAHADYREIGEWLGKADRGRLKRIFLVHGEAAAQQHLAAHLGSLGFGAVTILAAGAPVAL